MSEEFTVKKISYTVPVSCCVMTANTGVNYCEHPLPEPPSRWKRARWAMRDWCWRNKPHIHRGPCETGDEW